MATDPIETPYLFNGHIVPGIWRYLLPKDVHQYRLPDERRSTCSKCPQAKFEGYHPHYRCCAYHPIMPNFLLGLALRNKTSAKAVKNLLKMGFVIPEGMSRSPQQWIDYLADLSDDARGDDQRVQCPNMDAEGLCQVYAFRNGVCSTFFCLNDHGDRGHKFWDALEEMVTQCEYALSQWTLAELGFDVPGYFKKMDILSTKVDELFDPKTRCWNKETRAYLWGDWFGRELELLKQCGDLVAKNRDRLWEIANSTKILESDKFDKATTRAVPKEYRHEIDPGDLEDGESLPADELFLDLKRKYRALRRVPDKVRLSARAQLNANPKDDKESKAFARKPYVIEFLTRKGGSSYEWREFVGKKEFETLKFFKRPRKVTDQLFSKKELKALPKARDFVEEMVGKKVLERVP